MRHDSDSGRHGIQVALHVSDLHTVHKDDDQVVSLAEAQALALQVLSMETSAEIEDTAQSFIADRADPDFST